MHEHRMRSSFVLSHWAALGLVCCWGATHLRAAPFPDAHNPPPMGWTGENGRVFKLSQDYPATMPPAETYPWKAAGMNFKTKPKEYIQSVLQYCFDGNIDPGVDWDVDKRDPMKRKWYHAPWMHSDDPGREFIHGLTRERRSRKFELHPNQTDPANNWAVSIYNPPGGYVIGQVWQDHDKPDRTKGKFPDGTVSIKLLFTTASDTQVPFLKNSHGWKADINRDANADGSNVPTLHLLQIDVAVRDADANDTTGWVFGTFIYNGDAPGATPWDRMIPVGVMWGNDPGVTPAMVAAGTMLQESWINPDAKPLMQHLGWAGRLNGPVDNPQSSCLSCHSTAQHPASTGMAPPDNASVATRLKWFNKNVKAGEPFDNDGSHESLDYSLQLSVGIQRWEAATNAVFAATVNNQPMLFNAQGKRVFTADRDEDAPCLTPAAAKDMAAPAVVRGGLQPAAAAAAFDWKTAGIGAGAGFALAVVMCLVMGRGSRAGTGRG